MGKILDSSVTASSDGTYDFACPGVEGSLCGFAGTPFTSTGWPTKKSALARGQQHFDEHRGLSLTQPMEEFMADQGLTVKVAADGSKTVVKLGDL